MTLFLQKKIKNKNLDFLGIDPLRPILVFLKAMKCSTPCWALYCRYCLRVVTILFEQLHMKHFFKTLFLLPKSEICQI